MTYHEFGDEGQRWQLMTVHEFLANPSAISGLKARLQGYLAQQEPVAGGME